MKLFLKYFEVYYFACDSCNLAFSESFWQPGIEGYYYGVEPSCVEY